MAGDARLEYDADIIRVYTPFSSAYVRDIKTLPIGTRLWNKVGRYWAVDISQEQALMRIITKHFPDYYIGVEPEEPIGVPGHIKGKLWELRLRVDNNAT